MAGQLAKNHRQNFGPQLTPLDMSSEKIKSGRVLRNSKKKALAIGARGRELQLSTLKGPVRIGNRRRSEGDAPGRILLSTALNGKGFAEELEKKGCKKKAKRNQRGFKSLVLSTEMAAVERPGRRWGGRPNSGRPAYGSTEVVAGSMGGRGGKTCLRVFKRGSYCGKIAIYASRRGE